MARATPREWRSSPSRKMMLARSRSPAVATTSAALGPSLRHPHVERTVEAERKSALGLVELHRRDADIEHHAVDLVVAAFAGDIIEIGEAVFDQSQPALRRLHHVGAAGDRGLVAVDADHLAVGGGEDRARCSRRRRRCRRYRCRRRAPASCSSTGSNEHGNVPGQSASDVSAAARHHSRAPSGSFRRPLETRTSPSARAVTPNASRPARDLVRVPRSEMSRWHGNPRAGPDSRSRSRAEAPVTPTNHAVFWRHALWGVIANGRSDQRRNRQASGTNPRTD